MPTSVPNVIPFRESSSFPARPSVLSASPVASAAASPPAETLTASRNSEPYRLFFPLGVLLGIAGVAVWPLYHYGVIETYSGRAHAMVQVSGFLYSFIVGFLLTALPRITRTSLPGLFFKLTVASLIIGGVIAFEVWAFRWGNLLFLLAQCSVIGAAAQRFLRRRSNPPDTFPLVGIGLLYGAIGTTISALADWELIDPIWSMLGLRLLTEGMVLCLVMGIGAFLEPRLMGLVTAAADPDGRPTLPPPSRRRIFASIVAGLIMGITLYAQYVDSSPLAVWLRAIAVTFFMIMTVPPWRLPRVNTTPAKTIWLANLTILAALWGQAWSPDHGVDLLHFMFMGGFSLLIIAIATRVCLSHGGFHLDRESRSWPLRIGSFCIVIGLLSRIGAAFVVESYFEHLALAGIFWITGIVIWGVFITRLIIRPAAQAKFR